MNPKEAYDLWAQQYDTNKNQTRDIEGIAFREIIEAINPTNCLEIGCGTGKNTTWLATHAKHVTAIDFSVEMLSRAKEKVSAKNVEFICFDINDNWKFSDKLFDFISFSLVLEHIENLSHVFDQAIQQLQPGGFIYIGELHPFKQYTGTKANFTTADGKQEVNCFTHHVTDFTDLAKQHSLQIIELREYFDDPSRSSIPRLLAMLLKRS